MPNNGTANFKNVNNCLNTNIYSYLETTGDQSSSLYLNVAHFFNASVNLTSVAAQDSCFPALVSNTCCPINTVLIAIKPFFLCQHTWALHFYSTLNILHSIVSYFSDDERNFSQVVWCYFIKVLKHKQSQTTQSFINGHFK